MLKNQPQGAYKLLYSKRFQYGAVFAFSMSVKLTDRGNAVTLESCEFSMASKRKLGGLEFHSCRANSSMAQSASTTDEIARRAYEIYLKRGSGPGLDVEDWLRAERELT